MNNYEVTLTPLVENDAEALYEFTKDINIYDNLYPSTPKIEIIKNFINTHNKKTYPYSLPASGIYINKKLIGWVSLFMGPQRNTFEIACLIDSKESNKGYTGKAFSLFIENLLNTMPLPIYIYAVVYPTNIAALKILSKNNFHTPTEKEKALLGLPSFSYLIYLKK